MEQIKHECGVAMIRLRKPVQYYIDKYGTAAYGLDRLYLLMEKQHNRGQEAAGVGVIKFDAKPGNEYLFRERALGTGAITDIFANIGNSVNEFMSTQPDKSVIADEAPFIGNIYMGHLRYSTTGRSGISYVHPFLRRNNWRSRNLMLCGNFNMTNVDSIFDKIVATGQHPRLYSDTIVLLEQLGYYLDRENHNVYRELRDTYQGSQLASEIEHRLDTAAILRNAAPHWDGGFVICGATGSGDMFVLRDRNGIRPAFYYCDEEVVVVASERPVIQTVFNVSRANVNELAPGEALIVNRDNQISTQRILPAGENRRCSFERIYFSRGSDADIYRERKALGRKIADRILEMIDYNLNDTVFSFIPNTAEVAFIGLVEGLETYLNRTKAKLICKAIKSGECEESTIEDILSQKIRVEKVALKDIKLRTFIAEGAERSALAAHVYDVTYGCIVNNVDTLVVIDDSIVRGTTLRQSILKMLDRLHPRRIIVVSSSPQVRYPDCYGIDMSRMAEFIAFRAAISLLHKTNRSYIIDRTYEQAITELKKPAEEQVNCVKAIYDSFSDEEISKETALMLTEGEDIHAEVDIVYQSIEGLHEAMPAYPGDWYFTGNYPTAGGTRLVNQAFVNYYEGNPERR